MSGYSLICKIKAIEKQVDDLGFVMCQAKWAKLGSDTIGLRPKDQDSLPVYARDAELFQGSLQELECWLSGVTWAREYDRMLFGKGHKVKRERKEQDLRNEILVQILTKPEST